MKFVVRLKAQFCTDDRYRFNLQLNPHLKGDGSFYSSDIFITADDLFNCRIKAVNILRDWEKAVVSNDEDMTEKMENFIQTAIRNVQMDQKCNIELEGNFAGTSIQYVQIIADEVINIEEE